jgi:hypothetical protein
MKRKFLYFIFFISDCFLSIDEEKCKYLKFIIYQGGIDQIEMTPIIQAVSSVPKNLLFNDNNIKNGNKILSFFQSGYFKGFCIGVFFGNFKIFFSTYLMSGFFVIYNFLKKLKDKFSSYEKNVNNIEI